MLRDLIVYCVRYTNMVILLLLFIIIVVYIDSDLVFYGALSIGKYVLFYYILTVDLFKVGAPGIGKCILSQISTGISLNGCTSQW